jgi:hypothetical protein
MTTQDFEKIWTWLVEEGWPARPLGDGVAYVEKWLTLAAPEQLAVFAAAMRDRNELALADELERSREWRKEAYSPTSFEPPVHCVAERVRDGVTGESGIKLRELASLG